MPMTRPSWCYAEHFDRDGFAAWLAQQPVAIEPCKGEYDLVRYRMPDNQVVVIYSKPSKGRVSFPPLAWDHWQSFQQGGVIAPQPAALPMPKAERAPVNRWGISDAKYRLFTDASSYDQTSSGAWAGILVGPDFVETECHGPLRGNVSSSSAAEFMAVANSIHKLCASGRLPNGAEISLFCDNKAVVAHIARWADPLKMRTKSEEMRRAYAYLHDLAARRGIKIKANWIKGHQQPDSSNMHITMNRRADALCGKHGKALHRERCLAA